MPRRKIEKSHPWPLHPTPVKNKITLSAELNNEFSNVVDRSSFQKAAVAAPVSVERLALAGLSSRSAPQHDRLQADGQEAKQLHSLEALFQAADSELQNYSAGNAAPLPLTKPISRHGNAGSTQVPNVLNSSPGIHAQNSLTDVSVSSSFPLLRLNFHPNSQTKLHGLPSSLSQEVVCIKVVNANPGGQVTSGILPEAGAELQAVGILPGHCIRQLQPASKLEKSSVTNKPGKHVCPYCSRFCAKPSVLQKHIRTHTGERPYPCTDCGFRFKTKSNLYKHCKSRVHLTKSGGKILDCLSGADTYESQNLSDEMEDQQDDISPETSFEIPPTDNEKADKQEFHQDMQMSNLGLKYFSCDSVQAEIDSQNVSATSRSLSVPVQEINEETASVGTRSLLQLSDGSMYLMEKMSNGHAILRPVVQEVALPSAISIPCSVATSLSRSLKIADASHVSAFPISAVTDVRSSEKEQQHSAFEIGRVQSDVQQVTLLPESNAVKYMQMLQKLPSVSTTATLTSNKADVNLLPMLQMNDGSVCLIENVNTSHAVLRPIVQEPTPPLITLSTVATSTSPSFAKGNEIAVNSKAISIHLKSGIGLFQSEKEQQSLGLEKSTFQFEHIPITSIPNKTKHSKFLQKSSSAGVSTKPNPNHNIMTSHRSLSVPGSHNVSIAPKMAPIDPKNATPEAVQERIAMLISQNASIIDTPMADAPRPKRVLRHNSEAVAACGLKPDSSLTSAAKSLQRAKSLTPIVSAQSTVSSVNQFLISTSPEVGLPASISPIVKQQKAEFMKSMDSLANPTSKFLYVPDDPNLKGQTMSLKPIFGQVSNNPSSVGSTFQKPILPVKAKSLELSATPQKETFVSNPQSNVPVGKTVEEFSARYKNETLLEAPSVNGWKPFPVSQDVQMVSHLPNSVSVDLLKPSTRLDGMLSPVQSVAKDVAERRQEFARTHLVWENGGRAENSSRMTPVKSVETHLDSVLRINPSLPVQYIVITGNPDQSPAFLPVMTPTVSTLVPHVSATAVTDLPNQSIPTPVGGSPLMFSCIQEKTLKLKHVDKSSTPAASSCSVFRSIPSICITPADSNPPNESPESLWRMKLKGRLLMKRSSSNEKVLNDEREILPKRMMEAGKLSSSLSANEALQPLNSDSETFKDSGVLRSRSCDAAMPLKKRRKTLTELGRGTAFGTRVEDANEANQSAESESRPSNRYRLEFLKDVSSSVGVDEDVFLDQPEGKEEQDERMDSCSSASVCGSVPNSSSLPDKTPNIGTSEQHFPSVTCLRIAAKKLPEVVSTTHSPADVVPGLISHYVRPLPSVSNGIETRPMEEFGTVKHTVGNDELTCTKNVRCDQLLCRSKAKVPDFETDCSDEAGADAGSNYSEKNEEVAKTAPVMLLLGHLFPSLNVTTNPTFCSAVNPQPTYISQETNKKLSMYSNWQSAPSIGDSAMPDVGVSGILTLCQPNRTVVTHQYATSNISEPKSGVLTHSSYWNFKKELEMKSKSLEENKNADARVDSVEGGACLPSDKDDSVKLSSEKSCSADVANASVAVKVVSCNVQRVPLGANTKKEVKRIQICPGGYKSNEEYVYIRGRGKGKFVCELCGIRCKKPCMLMKHIRSHSDIRPHHCDVCSFGFKTKGNLSKHLKSKAHHLKCSELGISQTQTVSVNSGDLPVDSNQSAGLNAPSNSCDLNEEDMDDDDEYRFCNDESKDDDDEDKDESDDDDDGGDDVESLDLDESESLIRVRLAETVSAPEVTKISESSVSQSYCSPDKADVLRAVMDTEAAASLLDLSKGNQNTEIVSTASNNDGPCLAVSRTINWSSFNHTIPNHLSVVTDASNVGRSDTALLADASIPLRTSEFNSPVLFLTSYSNSSFPLSAPIFIAVSNASMLSAIPNSINHPWIILNPTTVVQKNANKNDCGNTPLTQEMEQRQLDQDVISSGTYDGECPSVSGVLSSVVSMVSPAVTCTETAAVQNKHRPLCEIVPVPGKVSGNVDECVNGKYVCGICRNSYHEPHQLTLHKNIHYLERPFRCSSCDVSFQNRALLERHQRSERHACRTDDPRPFKCDPCGVAFRIHGHLAKHLRSKSHVAKCESNEKSPVEDGYEEKDGNDVEPNVSFPQSESVDETVVSEGADETGTSNVVTEAEVAASLPTESVRNESLITTQFLNSSTLPTRLAIVMQSGQNISLSGLHGQRQNIKDSLPTVPLQCDMCTKSFTDISLFEKHINSHIELRPYICDICDAGFTGAHLLESHMKSHNKAKDPVCGVCGDILLGKTSPMEATVSSNVHCSLQNCLNVSTSPSVAGSQCGMASSDALIMCSLKILRENTGCAGQSQPQPAPVDGRNCATVAESVVSGRSDSLLRVVPMQNVFSLSDSNVLLMKQFHNVTVSKDSVDSNNFDLDRSVQSTTGSAVSLFETFPERATSTSRLLPGFVVATSSASASSIGRSAACDATDFHETLQQRPSIQAKSVEPVCRFLTVSFQDGENVSSVPLISSNCVRDNIFIAPNISELLPKHVALINSASNSVLPEMFLKSVSQAVSKM